MRLPRFVTLGRLVMLTAVLFIGSAWAAGLIDPESALGALCSGVLLLEAPAVEPNWASGARFSTRVGIPNGLMRGIAFSISGTTVTDSALNDDAPWTLISELRITLPLKRGDVVIQSTGRDLYLLSRYMIGNLRENQTAATAGVTFSSFFLPFGPIGWGLHSDDFQPGAEITIEGTWAAPSEYGASTTSITVGRLIPTIHVDQGAVQEAGRRAMIPTTTRLAIESASRFPLRRINKPALAEGLIAVMYRNEDASAAGDRVDGIVTRLQLMHTRLGTQHDQFFRDLRSAGLEWAGIDPAQVTAALPLGLDGTVFYIAAPTFNDFPDLTRGDLELTIDCAETVQAGAANVANAAGDATHCTVVASIIAGL